MLERENCVRERERESPRPNYQFLLVWNYGYELLTEKSLVILSVTSAASILHTIMSYHYFSSKIGKIFM